MVQLCSSSCMRSCKNIAVMSVLSLCVSRLLECVTAVSFSLSGVTQQQQQQPPQPNADLFYPNEIMMKVFGVAVGKRGRGERNQEAGNLILNLTV